MRRADVYVCMLADGVALRNRCPQGQADPRAAIAGGASGVTRDDGSGRPAPSARQALWAARAAIAGGASGVTMARAGPHSMRWADVYVPHVPPASRSPASMRRCPRSAPAPSAPLVLLEALPTHPRPALRALLHLHRESHARARPRGLATSPDEPPVVSHHQDAGHQ